MASAMEDGGYRLVSAEGGTMDSGMAVFEGASGTVKIVKDRGQWFHEGSAQSLRPHGLWQAFDDLDEFVAAIHRYHKETGPNN